MSFAPVWMAGFTSSTLYTFQPGTGAGSSSAPFPGARLGSSRDFPEYRDTARAAYLAAFALPVAQVPSEEEPEELEPHVSEELHADRSHRRRSKSRRRCRRYRRCRRQTLHPHHRRRRIGSSFYGRSRHYGRHHGTGFYKSDYRDFAIRASHSLRGGAQFAQYFGSRRAEEEPEELEPHVSEELHADREPQEEIQEPQEVPEVQEVQEADPPPVPQAEEDRPVPVVRRGVQVQHAAKTETEMETNEELMDSSDIEYVPQREAASRSCCSGSGGSARG
ncbi:hypothetical protein E2562_002900 [Oryza meyeriana var. granulata]|uniref:Uncharacterized protein n=1 Tax=Oryza meyeriana var. granulata TaxID=110450 RepID=A0A6G1DCA9_9ORYZ|nr:hypothetical protein E2562_002900 [Oryza meyeriana var. granulata]